MSNSRIFTIGHSTHPFAEFVGLLRRHGVTALADVRSTPFSHFNPQFNRPALQQGMKAHAIKYVFLGRELGARPQDRSCYENGQVRFDRLKETALFKGGIKRVMRGLETCAVALMCAEKDPKDCHRALLVAPALTELGVEVFHIMEDGSIEPHAGTVSRMPDPAGEQQEDLFNSKEHLALAAQGKQVAYARKKPPAGKQGGMT